MLNMSPILIFLLLTTNGLKFSKPTVLNSLAATWNLGGTLDKKMDYLVMAALHSALHFLDNPLYHAEYV